MFCKSIAGVAGSRIFIAILSGACCHWRLTCHSAAAFRQRWLMLAVAARNSSLKAVANRARGYGAPLSGTLATGLPCYAAPRLRGSSATGLLGYGAPRLRGSPATGLLGYGAPRLRGSSATGLLGYGAPRLRGSSATGLLAGPRRECHHCPHQDGLDRQAPRQSRIWLQPKWQNQSSHTHRPSGSFPTGRESTLHSV